MSSGLIWNEFLTCNFLDPAQNCSLGNLDCDQSGLLAVRVVGQQEMLLIEDPFESHIFGQD